MGHLYHTSCLKAQGTLQKREQKIYKSQRSGKSGSKQGHLNETGQLHSGIQRHWDCLYNAKQPKPPTLQQE